MFKRLTTPITNSNTHYTVHVKVTYHSAHDQYMGTDRRHILSITKDIVHVISSLLV